MFGNGNEISMNLKLQIQNSSEQTITKDSRDKELKQKPLTPEKPNKPFRYDTSDPEEFQKHTIEDFYFIYINSVSECSKYDPDLIKRSFDDYEKFVNPNYIKNINKSFCNYFPNEGGLSDLIDVERHPDHATTLFKTLTPEFYILFKVLDMLWKNEHISKKDVLYLTPCRVFILCSIIKRKFNEVLDFA